MKFCPKRLRKTGREACPTVGQASRPVLLLILLIAAAYPQTIDRAEGLWKAKDYKAAGQAFEALLKRDAKNSDYKVRYGRLLLERFNPGDATGLFQEALEIKKDHAGALLGLALVAADGFEGKAAELAHAALMADPTFPRNC